MIADVQAWLDMIVKFSTSIGQLTMHGDAAVALLKGMGHSGTVPGAILAADLPGALAQLQRMLETSGHTTGAPPLPPAQSEEEEREREPVITLKTRAVPLLDMIRTALARKSDLMWERG
jgi:Domain of unknown function (DUF1840)